MYVSKFIPKSKQEALNESCSNILYNTEVVISFLKFQNIL